MLFVFEFSLKNAWIQKKIGKAEAELVGAIKETVANSIIGELKRKSLKNFYEKALIEK